MWDVYPQIQNPGIRGRFSASAIAASVHDWTPQPRERTRSLDIVPPVSGPAGAALPREPAPRPFNEIPRVDVVQHHSAFFVRSNFLSRRC